MVAAWFNQKWVLAEPGELVCGCVPVPDQLWQGDSGQCCAPLQQDQRRISLVPAAVSQAALVVVLHNKSLCVDVWGWV